MSLFYVAIGSNLGNRLQYIQRAVSLLKEQCLSDLRLSIVLETPALLPADAPEEWDRPYLNMVVRGESSFPPEKVLERLKQIETMVGREESYKKWAPRVIDLDILLWDGEPFSTPSLAIPHPELLNRPFLIHLLALLDSDCRYHSLSEGPYNTKTFGEIAHTYPDISTCYTRSFVVDPKFVGVVNITPDSFSDGGINLSPEGAIARCQQLILEGATVVELGPQSTRPQAIQVDSVTEYARVQPILEGLSDSIKRNDIIISLDTFLPETILKVLETYPIAWINDVKGELDDNTLRTIAERELKIVVMHSLTVPPLPDHYLDFESSPIDHLNQWSEMKIDHLEKCGFQRENIILDPGIGFGKTLSQNLFLLKHVQQLKKFGCELMMGHSRKSYISSFYKSEAKDRDLETIAISAELARNGVNYLRVHNVKDHQRFFVAHHLVTED